MSESFWKGAFAPVHPKNSFQKCDKCSESGPTIWFEEPEFGLVRVNFSFNHVCRTGPAPSNDKVYSFDYELENFDSAMYDDVVDLEANLGQMSSSEKMRWLNENVIRQDA